jgi:hypothetical protein
VHLLAETAPGLVQVRFGGALAGAALGRCTDL